MKKFILKRIYTAFIVVLVVVALNFFIIKLAPGDPVNIMAGFDNPNEEFKMAVRAKYNLDKPLITQFFTYIYRLVQGDLGESYYSSRPVTELLAERMGASLLLSGTSAVLAFIIGTVLGLTAGKKEDSMQDKVLSAGTYVANAMPSFWLGLMLIFVFASRLGWLPTQGMYSLRENYTGIAKYIDLGKHLILPVTTLVLVQIPGYFRITRSSVIQVMADDYITTFRVTGMSEKKIYMKYVLKNAILPVVTLFGINVAYIVAGSTLVETVFSWQGIGILMYTAIAKRDYNVLMGTYLIIAVSVAFFMILVDVIYAKLDPRIHYE
ncbi:ABC transporter permease [Dorea formicigenerans]|uniref:ABC transporter permease n=1 Tax=Dorea formicigenerans TaxID=39486 RepID=UPI001D003FC8|nr:ABC transporter permease [Dorea formicigenerans]MCB5500589.1 ABC transporter permease [Dorea formicigenerans]